MIETDRLILRAWRDEDREAYADIMIHPEVGAWLGGPFTREQAHERVTRFQAGLAETGLGRLAIERTSDGRLIGHCGLAYLPETLPLAPGIEIGWALAPDAWGAGYAVEAARAVIADGFANSDISEILAFTGASNLRSQAVMQRLGMTRAADRDFDRPGLSPDQPLRRHIVYVATRLK
ncbi:GNAT family N-acetyltransferase [Phenylobacterium sp.]|uniref:GNAT family N-acetyltransferase n=1 Tax=Phenylobacterium sp. TaxID=1871053 RepID=UPI00374CD01F